MALLKGVDESFSIHGHSFLNLTQIFPSAACPEHTEVRYLVFRMLQFIPNAFNIRICQSSV